MMICQEHKYIIEKDGLEICCLCGIVKDEGKIYYVQLKNKKDNSVKTNEWYYHKLSSLYTGTYTFGLLSKKYKRYYNNQVTRLNKYYAITTNFRAISEKMNLPNYIAYEATAILLKKGKEKGIKTYGINSKEKRKNAFIEAMQYHHIPQEKIEWFKNNYESLII